MGILPKISVLCFCLYIFGAGAEETSTKVIISSIKSPPYLMETSDHFEGFVKDMTDEICKRLDKDCKLKLVKDGKYGVMNSTGKWTGMIGELMNEECDMVIADLTITAARAKVVDFSRPILMSRLAIVHKIKKMNPKNMNMMTESDFFTMLKPMTPLVWISFLVLMCMHIGLIMLIESKMMVLRNEKEMQVMRCPRSKAGRVMSMLFMVWLVMFVAIYISSLTAQRMDKMNNNNDIMHKMKGSKFSTLEELINDPKMKYGFIANGATAMFLKNAKNPMFNRIHEQVKKWQTMTSNSMEGIMKVMEDEDANFAFIMESKTAEFMVRKHCDLYMVPKLFGPDKGFCVAMKKGSTMMPKLDIEILKMKEEGLIENLYKKWWKSGSPCHHNRHNMCMDNISSMDMDHGMMNRNNMEDCMDCHKVTMRDMGCMYLFTVCGMMVGILLAVFDSKRSRG